MDFKASVKVMGLMAKTMPIPGLPFPDLFCDHADYMPDDRGRAPVCRLRDRTG